MFYRSFCSRRSLNTLCSQTSRNYYGMKGIFYGHAAQRHQVRLNANTASILSGNKPFRILGLQQIAVGSTEEASMQKLWVDIFGLEKVGRYVSEKENVAEDILNLGRETDSSVPIEIDLMCPLDENRSPSVHKPALNHVGLWVDDLERAVEWMDSKGVRFTPGGIRKGAAGHDVTFIHPKGSADKPIGGAGVLIELVQAPEEVVTKLVGQEMK